jgi:hypothetical protein
MELGRYESHYATIARLFANMLEKMDETQVREIAELAMQEAIQIAKQEKEERK